MNTLDTVKSVAAPRLIIKEYVLYAFTKRALDIVISSIALIALFPLLLLVSLTVKLTSKGTAIYWQKRVGLNGEIINFPKIRSMVVDAEKMVQNLQTENHHKNSITFKIKSDPRITPVGKIIRKLSIDELPQLWLVLTGKLSLVGPRPALIKEVKEYNSYERQRLLVKPGLTCIWQVSGRGDIAFDDQVKMDLDYIDHRSIWLDLKLLSMTIPAVLTAKGAY